MKRKIVFRGKRKDTGKWVFGNLVRNIEDTFVLMCQMDNTYNYCEVDKKTIGQFTGLFDANKKGIYEGDVIHFLYDRKQAVVAWNKLGMWCLLFNDDPSGLLSKKPLGRWLREDDLEVVGSIYDNPELLGI